MSNASIRAAVRDYFDGTDGIAEVYSAQPTFVGGQDFQLNVAGGSGAVAYVHLVHADESRITLGGPQTGYKSVQHDVALVILYQYLIPSGTAAPQQLDAWSDPLDAIIDAVKARLRADPTCGVGYQPVTADGVVFQAGEQSNDIVVDQDLPRLMSGKIISWNVVRFQLIELVLA